MILLDTNVVSELMRGQKAERRVRDWMRDREPAGLHLAAITVAELRFGVAVLPEGRRRTDLSARLDATLDHFGGRILPFTGATAGPYGRLMAQARAKGRAVGLADGLIAATAAEHGLAVATRDVAPFAAVGLRVVDPWGGAP
mgnify:CR=1 FL=1